MTDITWKPGPPPLGVNGDYFVSFDGVIRHVEVDENDYWDGNGDLMGASWLERATHYLGPIPSPPTGELE